MQPLSDLLADRTADSGARGRAAQALGKIDADASKEVLLRSLAPDNPDEFTVRMDAIDALGKSRNESVIASLQRCVETEKEESLKQRILGAISEIRSRIQ